MKFKIKKLNKENLQEFADEYVGIDKDPAFVPGNYIIQSRADHVAIVKRNDYKWAIKTTGKYFGNGWYEVKYV